MTLTNEEKYECVKMLNDSLNLVFNKFTELFPEIKIEKSGDLMVDGWSCRVNHKTKKRKDLGI